MIEDTLTAAPPAAVAQNGHAEAAPPSPPAASAGPRIQRREEWIDLPEPYVGFKLKAWLNHPNHLWQDFVARDDPDADADVRAAIEQRRIAAFREIVLEHNGWVDFDGNPYPPASDAEAFVDAIPMDLAVGLVSLLKRKQLELGNAWAPPTRRR